MKEEMLVIENGGICKDNHDIFRELYVQIFKGEIFGIIFDNILEKDCLLEFLKGRIILDYGLIFLNGEKIDIKDSNRLFTDYITVIERTSKLVHSLSIVENVLMFAPVMPKYYVDKKSYAKTMEKVMEELMVRIPMDKPVLSLTSKERVIIELIKAYVEGKKLVVMANAGGFLKSMEFTEVFALINRLRELGMTFAIIESFEGTIFKWTDRLAIVKNGKTLGIYKSQDIKRQQIYSALIGNQYGRQTGNLTAVEQNEPEKPQASLVLSGINTEILDNFNFTINKGQVVKIYYMDDLSFIHIVELLKGLRKPLSGHISVNNREYSVNSVHMAVKQGVCFIEESPDENMLFYNMSVLDNLCLALARKVPMLWAKKKFTKSVKELIAQHMGEDISNIKLSKLPPVKLQQIAYFKWLLYVPSVVVCIKPFTEADIYLREVTVNMIEMLRMRGISVIIFTPNFSETYQIDGKTIYIRNGKLIDEDEVYQILYREG